MKPEKSNPILEKSFQFALDIITYCEQLEANRKFILSNQLLKSGTSIGANVKEAQSAQSRADFIHKLKIADKEAEETEYWLELCKRSPTYPKNDRLLEDLKPLQKLLTSIIASTHKNS